MGDLCLLRIRTDWHSHSVKATCRVVVVMPLDDGGFRVCFQFTNRIELFAQLDEFYARLFNRRRHARGVADPEVPTPVKLEWSGGSLSGIAHDISEGGLGMTVPHYIAKAMPKRANVVAMFRLPGQQVEIVCRAAIRCRTKFANNTSWGSSSCRAASRSISRPCVATSRSVWPRSRTETPARSSARPAERP